MLFLYNVWFEDVELPVNVEARDRYLAAIIARRYQAKLDGGTPTAPYRFIQRIEKIIGNTTSSAD